jgi:hypothetical protein
MNIHEELYLKRSIKTARNLCHKKAQGVKEQIGKNIYQESYQQKSFSWAKAISLNKRSVPVKLVTDTNIYWFLPLLTPSRGLLVTTDVRTLTKPFAGRWSLTSGQSTVGELRSNRIRRRAFCLPATEACPICSA